jgi:hypothetical protein
MVSVQAAVCIGPPPTRSPGALEAAERTTGGQEAPGRAVDGPPEAPALAWRQHPWWNAGKGWKPVLQNRRLLTQPFMAECRLSPWREIITMPALQEGRGPLRTRLHECYTERSI